MFMIEHFDVYILKRKMSEHFIVEYRTVRPKLIPFTFGDDAMNYDETVSATCTVSGGDSPINFVWLLNGVPITPYQDILMEKKGNRISVLMIESLKATHMGNYTCVAENSAGTAEYTSPLIVNG